MYPVQISRDLYVSVAVAEDTAKLCSCSYGQKYMFWQDGVCSGGGRNPPMSKPVTVQQAIFTDRNPVNLGSESAS